ncbi:protein FAM117A-like [Polymixia lowei]
MSGRGGLGLTRGATLGPQPLRATVPYQLHSKARPERKDGKSAGKTKSHQLVPGMRRTVSLDAIIGPYLQGHWPKEPEGQGSLPHMDKSTQTPDSWSDRAQGRRGGSGHKRSASWGSAEHLREIAQLKQQLQQRTKAAISWGPDPDSPPPGGHGPKALQTPPGLAPLSRLAPWRCSVEGLNQELEGMFICQPPFIHSKLLEVPDGHRAPVPPQSSSQSDSSTAPLSPTCSSSSTISSCSSPSSSPPPRLPTSPSAAQELPGDLDQGVMAGGEKSLLCPLASDPALLSSSPRPNNTYCFQREPPEGCERVRVCDESSAARRPGPAFISSCPDPNKVNFTPHGGSAFCPVSLLQPPLPSVDLLFHSLAVSPPTGCSARGPASYRAPSPGGSAPRPESTAAAAL